MTGSHRTLILGSMVFVLVVACFALKAKADGSEASPFVGGAVLPAAEESKTGEREEFPAPFEPLPKTITPCRACHGPEKDFQINWTREEVLRVHTDIRLKHGGVRVWCLDCHDPVDREHLLPLSDGEKITFERSYELCGKCHGTKYRDWRNGIHGKRTGYWNGKKTYRLCTQCHNPHTPRFEPIKPMPPPRKPRTPKLASDGH